jgi:molybdenum cofactor cytidylyltransferase
MESRTGIIILAAGNSSRLGQPKQLLPYKNTTLLDNIITQASLVHNSVVMVVTGSNHELILSEKQSDQTLLYFNPDWESGMSTSIHTGITKLQEFFPEIEKCIFAVCDQPHVSSIVFENLIKAFYNEKKGIAASAYADTLGTPVLFDKKYFSRLQELKGQEGAKKIINAFLDDTAAVPFEKGNIDIDTPQDYHNLLNE